MQYNYKSYKESRLLDVVNMFKSIGLDSFDGPHLNDDNEEVIIFESDEDDGTDNYYVIVVTYEPGKTADHIGVDIHFENDHPANCWGWIEHDYHDMLDTFKNMVINSFKKAGRTLRNNA